jgi:hypothetical protein
MENEGAMSRGQDRSAGREISRVKIISAFELTERSTVLVVEIIHGVVRAGDVLQHRDRLHTIASVEYVDGPNLPMGTVGLRLGEAGAATHFVSGEEHAVLSAGSP